MVKFDVQNRNRDMETWTQSLGNLDMDDAQNTMSWDLIREQALLGKGKLLFRSYHHITAAVALTKTISASLKKPIQCLTLSCDAIYCTASFPLLPCTPFLFLFLIL